MSILTAASPKVNPGLNGSACSNKLSIKSPAKTLGKPGMSYIGFFGYISEHCPPGAGSESIRWHFNLSKPASKTVNKPTGPAPIIIMSVLIIL